MKKNRLVVLLFALVLTCCKQEIRLKDKFGEGAKYDVEVFYVHSSFGHPRIELRNKNGSSVISYKNVEKGTEATSCEFFFFYNDGTKVLDVCVNTGGPEWRWAKMDKQDWIVIDGQ